MHVCVCLCACVCMRVCMCAFMRGCVRACVSVSDLTLTFVMYHKNVVDFDLSVDVCSLFL